MASQDQNFEQSRLDHSQLQQNQAGNDVFSFQNSDDNHVIINNILLRLFGNSQAKEVDWDFVRRLLEIKQLPEISQRLRDTIGGDRNFIEVAIAEEPHWVNRSPLEADRILLINGENQGIIDPNQLLIETFGRDDIQGKLLILGSPGSGKTTALLSLAEQLVYGALAQPKTVIPVMLELSTWRKDDQSIQDWIVEQLYDLHGGDRKSKIYEQWLDREILLPLLDGLDELGLERQEKCTQKLNEFSRIYPQLVVCCRLNEFKQVNQRLRHLRGAVCLQPLSDGQIKGYLESIGRPELGLAMQDHSILGSLLETTPEGEPGLLRVPLFLRLTVNLYDPDRPIEGKKDLLERYIEGKLSFDQRDSDRRKGLERRKWAYKTVKREPKSQETRKILSWIAGRLKADNTVELLIEKMQPSWIESGPWRWRYRLMVGVMVGLMLGLFLGLSWSPIIEVMIGLIVGLIVGVIFGLTEIKPVEKFQISLSLTARQKFCHGFLCGSTVGVIFGLICGGIAWLTADLRFGLINGFINTLIFGLFYGLILGLINGLKHDLGVRSRPNQGIQNSLGNPVITTVLINLCGMTLVFIVILSLSTTILKNHTFIVQTDVFRGCLKVGFTIALCLGLLFGGGIACIQHFCLRYVLWQSGAIPWNFARFLDYCVERRLLLRVGGHYRFLHRELLDYFANLSE